MKTFLVLFIMLAGCSKPKSCTLPSGQPHITLPDQGGVKYPDGFVYQCKNGSLEVVEDPLPHLKSIKIEK